MSETLQPALPDHLDEQAERPMRALTGESKAELLGIAPDVLKKNQAASEVVARAMAEGALARSHADLALGGTGFAGPAGEGHEQGLVYMALARRNGPTTHRAEHFGAIGRGPVRVKALKVMLNMLEQALQQE